MSCEPVIEARDLGKLYPIYARPQDRLKQALFRGRRRFYTPFWALRNVSFEVARGESVGIVGRNGSGKTTLLQIIAGTLAPSEGEVRVRGRVAALLQLGSGFNPQFTGRENVFLNGSILGIPRAEMERRFDEIAAFAEIGEHIDQPVRTYSSGMYARLAFAVAISVEPDVLIVDEILSVGDVGFQQKCVARLRQLREAGLTLLFVSHSPDAVRSTCQKALFLADGAPRAFGPAEQVVNAYLKHVRTQTNAEALEREAKLGPARPFRAEVPGRLRYGTGHVQIEEVELLDARGEPCRSFPFGDAVTIEARLRSEIDVEHLSVSFLVRDATGVDLLGTTSFDEGVKIPALAAGGRAAVRFTFTNVLRKGSFGVSLAVHRVSRSDYSDNVLFDQVDGCAAFAVTPNPARPIHYKFHVPVNVEVETSHG
jgi:lipopolysaccharide transport system ATP-binding protein